jgi:hypothetical protein
LLALALELLLLELLLLEPLALALALQVDLLDSFDNGGLYIHLCQTIHQYMVHVVVELKYIYN